MALKKIEKENSTIRALGPAEHKTGRASVSKASPALERYEAARDCLVLRENQLHLIARTAFYPESAP